MNNEIERFLIKDNTPLQEALRILNETGKRVVFLVDGDKLRGSLSYGDVSRWILAGKSLDEPAYEAATKEPITIRVGDEAEADKLFSDTNVNAIPIVDDENRMIDITFKEQSIRQYNQIDLPVVVMAGGRGTRLYPYTKILPKPLIPIGEIPIIELVSDRFYKNGCRTFYFIVNYKKNMIKAYFNETKKQYAINFVDENKPLGTGGGLKLLDGIIGSTFILTNCDSFIDEDYCKIVNAHKANKNMVTMVCSRQSFEIPYGVIETDEKGNLDSIREKPNLSYLTNTGTYIVEPEIMKLIKQGESIGFPDIIKRAKKNNWNVGIYTVDGKAWLDMGQFDSMEVMKRRMNIKD